MGHSLIHRYTVRDWWRDHRDMAWFGIHRQEWRPWFRTYGILPDFWYYLKCRLWRRYHVVTLRDLPPTWTDANTRMLHANFILLADVIEGEEIFENTGADGDPTDGQSWAWALGEMQALWHWWTVERPAREQRYEAALTVWHDLHMRDLDAYDAGHPGWRTKGQSNPRIQRFSPGEDYEAEDTQAAWDALRAIDDEVRDAEDNVMLKRLIDVRQYLWV